MKTLKQLSEEIHAINREKGFWDEPKTEMQCLLLVQSELFEALEAHRKWRITETAFILDKIIHAFSIHPVHAAIDFEFGVKDTLGDELADIIIRLLDFAAAFEIFRNIGENLAFKNLKDFSPISKDRFFQWVHNTNGSIFYLIEDGSTKEDSVIYIITQCFRICPAFGINLEAHIEAKIEYNRTRPTKHNKNY